MPAAFHDSSLVHDQDFIHVFQPEQPLPTINGLGSDHPLARGEIGRDGVPVNSLEDVEELFEGIPTGEVSTSLVIAYPPIPCMYIATAEKQGFKPGQLRGTFQNDSICRDVAANVRVVPRRAELKLCVDVVQEARTCLAAGMARNPEYADLHHMSALLQVAQAHLATADAALQRALDTNPRYAAARSTLAHVYLNRGRFDQSAYNLEIC